MKSFKGVLAVIALLTLVPLAANANNMKAYEEMVENIDDETEKIILRGQFCRK